MVKKIKKQRQKNKGRRRARGETLEHLYHINKTNCQRHLRGEESEMHRGEWLNETQVWLIRQPIKQKGQQTENTGPDRKQEALNRSA